MTSKTIVSIILFVDITITLKPTFLKHNTSNSGITFLNRNTCIIIVGFYIMLI